MNKSRKNDLVLSNGAHVDFKMGIDEAGMSVISHLAISFEPGAKIPSGGISAILLREVKIADILKMHNLESAIPSIANYSSALNFIKNEFSSSRSAYSDAFYAYLAFLYIHFLQSNPTSPTAKLSEALDIPRKTVVNRISKARAIGMISESDFVYKASPTGKSGGVLSDKAIKIINQNKLGK